MVLNKKSPSKQLRLSVQKLTAALAVSVFGYICLFALQQYVWVQDEHKTVDIDSPFMRNDNKKLFDGSGSNYTVIENMTTFLERRKAEKDRDRRHNSIHLVISHCKYSFEWIWSDYLKDLMENQNYSIKSITIISKCGVRISKEEMPPVEICSKSSKPSIPLQVSVLSLPNVGRCDHTYAYWIAMILQMGAPNEEEGIGGLQHKVLFNNPDYTGCNLDNSMKSRDDRSFSIDIDPTDGVLFMKDNDNRYRKSLDVEEEVPLIDMFENALNDNTNNVITQTPMILSYPRGFACAATAHLKIDTDNILTINEMTKSIWTIWAHRSIVWGFHMPWYERSVQEYGAGSNPKHDNNQGKTPDEFISDHIMGSWIQHFDADDFSKNYLMNVMIQHNPRFVGPNTTHSKDYREHDLVPICYGGVFATQWGQLFSEDAAVTPRGWNHIARSLSRGDNILEGHFMERWWAELLSWSSYASSSSSGNANAPGVGSEQIIFRRNNNGFLSKNDTNNILDRKLAHWGFPKPYQGLIMMENPVIEDTHFHQRK